MYNLSLLKRSQCLKTYKSKSLDFTEILPDI